METTQLLVCAATWMELQAWQAIPNRVFQNPTSEKDAEQTIRTGEWMFREELTLFVTGVGIPAALANTLHLLQCVRPACILNIGIAGAYLRDLPTPSPQQLRIGDIAIGTSEVYGDVGFELSTEPKTDAPHFQSIQSSPFGETLYASLPLSTELYGRPLNLFSATPPASEAPNDSSLETAASAISPYSALAGKGCTVNQCTGTAQTGRLRASLFDADFESMEGAAVAQAGQLHRIPVVEIRSISNYASTRDMRPENIRLALTNLRRYLSLLQKSAGD